MENVLCVMKILRVSGCERDYLYSLGVCFIGVFNVVVHIDGKKL